MTGDIAYQGAPGALSEQACLEFVPEYRPVARPSFQAVAQAVVDGDTDLGMLPRENSLAGPVPGVKEIIEESGLVVRGRLNLPIKLHLMALPGVTIDELTLVTSHPMALAQCAATLNRLGIQSEAVGNTAFAAQAVATAGNRTRAAIASEAAAEVYGLTILMRDIHDRPDNVTTFYVVAREGWERA